VELGDPVPARDAACDQDLDNDRCDHAAAACPEDAVYGVPPADGIAEEDASPERSPRSAE
jgi:hypothetical protein